MMLRDVLQQWTSFTGSVNSRMCVCALWCNSWCCYSFIHISYNPWRYGWVERQSMAWLVWQVNITYWHQSQTQVWLFRKMYSRFHWFIDQISGCRADLPNHHARFWQLNMSSWCNIPAWMLDLQSTLAGFKLRKWRIILGQWGAYIAKAVVN